LSRLVRAPDYCLAASQEIASVAEGLAPGVSVEALTNGVETEVFQRVEPTLEPDSRPRIVVPRRLFPKNGVEHFVRALPLILRETEVTAVFIGDGPQRKELEELAVRLGIRDQVDFLGKRTHAEMPGLLSSGTIAVIPSLMEATSVAALEAMACELPVAASRVGGLPEIVDDEVGTLFEPGDPQDLAGAVTGLLRDADLAAMGRRGRERVVEAWSNERLADRHEAIYRGLLRERESRV
jgi:glycosyltransferase involved in cell wall biosynthesis